MIAAATENVHAALSALTDVELRVARADEPVDMLVLGWGADVEALPPAQVVQVLSAGTDWIEPHVGPETTLCSARGARDVPVAEWVVGALLGALTGLLEGARRSTWVEHVPAELHGARVLILGHGSIGRAVEARLAPFGVTVVGVGRSRLGELPALLPGVDAVVVLAPLTSASRGMVDAAFLGAMRDGALLVNAGRGKVVDTDALVAELASGRLRAVLDVTDPEPLPDGHPLWSLALCVTPHHAGDSQAADERALRLAAEQLGRYARGEELLNVVGGR